MLAKHISQQGELFRHKEDRLPVLIISLLTLLDFVLYFTVDSFVVLFVYYLLMMLPKASICAWNHHHQHIFTFRKTFLNRVLELVYALHTGVTTHLWRLHHVLGHHLNFLDQDKDESRWKRRSGKQMGALEYSLNVALTAYPRGYQVSKRFPKQRRAFILYALLTLVVVAALIWFNPLAGVMLFAIPMATSLLLTAYVTYSHHAGLDTQNEFEASYNNLSRWYNIFTGNLGYHTAHHHKQGVHWSKLPQLHASIEDKIPPHLYQQSLVTKMLLGG